MEIYKTHRSILIYSSINKNVYRNTIDCAICLKFPPKNSNYPLEIIRYQTIAENKK